MKIKKVYWETFNKILKKYIENYVDPDEKTIDEFAIHAKRLMELSYRSYGEEEFEIADNELYFLDHILYCVEQLDESFVNSTKFNELYEQVSNAYKLYRS